MTTSDAGTSSDEMDKRVNRTVAIIRRTILIGLCLAGLTGAILTPYVLKAREAARRTNCKGHLKAIGLALHNYHDHFGSFPPAFVRGPDGQPWHSWRVLILPYLDQTSLYEEYNFAEPWDGPNNRKLIARMPETFVCPSRPSSSEGFTSYAGVSGPRSIFNGTNSVRISDIISGTSSTLFVGECARTRIPWTKPEDIDIILHLKLGDPEGFSSFHDDKVQFLVADGTVRAIHLACRQEYLDQMYMFDIFWDMAL
jgi:hypothetical protein